MGLYTGNIDDILGLRAYLCAVEFWISDLKVSHDLSLL